MLDITEKGYEIFRNNIHMNCTTGLIHSIGMPIILSQFFTIIQSMRLSMTCDINIATNDTKYVMYLFSVLFLAGYMTYSPVMGFLTIIFYVYIITGTLRNNKEKYLEYIDENSRYYENETYLFSMIRISISLLMIIISLFMMEIVGHWMIEGNSSNLSHIVNSIYWTPLYGMYSYIYPMTKQCIA